MSVTFKSKPVAINYKFWTSYKLIQLLMILKVWKSAKLREVYFIIYVIDNNIDYENLKLDNPIIVQNYFSNKIIEFALIKKLVVFKRLRLKITETGKEILKEKNDLDIFKDLEIKINNISKNKEVITEYLEEVESYYVENK